MSRLTVVVSIARWASAGLMGSHPYGIDMLWHDLTRFSALLSTGNDRAC
jgi:hypothetical protein